MIVLFTNNDNTNQYLFGMGMNKKNQKKKTIPNDIPIIWVNIV
jgi:hypothetical protein